MKRQGPRSDILGVRKQTQNVRDVGSCCMFMDMLWVDEVDDEIYDEVVAEMCYAVYDAVRSQNQHKLQQHIAAGISS